MGGSRREFDSPGMALFDTQTWPTWLLIFRNRHPGILAFSGRALDGPLNTAGTPLIYRHRLQPGLGPFDLLHSNRLAHSLRTGKSSATVTLQDKAALDRDVAAEAETDRPGNGSRRRGRRYDNKYGAASAARN